MNTLELLPLATDGQILGLQIAVGGLGISALVLVVARLLRCRPEPLRYGILLTGVIGLLAVPLLVALGRAWQPDVPWFTVPADDAVMRLPVEMLPVFLDGAAPESPDTAGPALAGPAMGTALLAIWLVGTIIGVGRLLYALWKQRRALVGRAPWHASFWTDERKAQLARQLGLRRFPAVYSSPTVPMPMVVGIWRPTIVLPAPAPATWLQPQWEAVLLHEAAHIARGDHWAALAQRVAVILFWWWPLVHVLARRLNVLRENICDDCALEGTCDRIAYAELLVESADHFLRLTTAALPLGLLDSAHGGLQARVLRLLEKERSTMTRVSLPGKLLGALLLMTACLLTTAGTAFSGGPPQPPKRIQVRILVDGKEIDLSDPQLWEHVAAAQKKALAAEGVKALKVIGDANPDEPGKVVVKVKDAAFSPDGRFLATGDGKRVIIWDPQTGKAVVSGDHARPDAALQLRLKQAQPAHAVWQILAAQAGQQKVDPRIEDLVKQAEAIKPGSGAEIRKALQAAPKPVDPAAGRETKAVPPKLPAAGTVRVWDGDSGKVIITIDHDGKIIRLNNADLHKLLGQPMRLELDLNLPKHTTTDKMKVLELHNKLIRDPAAEKKAVPAPADLESLARQLERLNVELNDLRKRLEAPKK